MIPCVILNVQTRKSLKILNREFFERWNCEYPNYFPSKIGKWEPITKKASIEDCVSSVGSGTMLWTAENNEGYISNGGKFCNTFCSDLSWDPSLKNYEMFFDWICETLDPQFAHLHLNTDEEASMTKLSGPDYSKFQRGFSIAFIESEGLPEIGWKTIVSDEFAEKLKYEGPAVLKVTDLLSDVLNYEKFCNERENLKNRWEIFEFNNRQSEVEKFLNLFSNNDDT